MTLSQQRSAQHAAFADLVADAKREFVAHFGAARAAAAASGAIEPATPYIYVYTSCTRGSKWTADDDAQARRPRAGYGSWRALDGSAPPQRWFQAQIADFDGTLRHLADLVFGADDADRDNVDAVPLALFWRQMLGQTRVLSGQRDRRTVLEVVRDVLVYRLVPKDLAFVLRRAAHADSLAAALKRALAYADKASVWKPSCIVPLLRDAAAGQCEAAAAAPRINVACLAGSWASPVVAALHSGGAAVAQRIESLLVVDVLPEFERALRDVLQPRAPFRIDARLHGGSEGAPLRTNTTLHGRYDLLLWNPPYWTLEMYDMPPAPPDGRDDAAERPAPASAAQSTADRTESFGAWLQRFVRASAANAARLLRAGGRLVLVVPNEFRIQDSYLRAPAWVNTDGLHVLPRNGARVADFGERFVDALQQGAADAGAALVEVARVDKVAPNSVRKAASGATVQRLESTIVFERRCRSGSCSCISDTSHSSSSTTMPNLRKRKRV